MAGIEHQPDEARMLRHRLQMRRDVVIDQRVGERPGVVAGRTRAGVGGQIDLVQIMRLGRIEFRGALLAAVTGEDNDDAVLSAAGHQLGFQG